MTSTDTDDCRLNIIDNDFYTDVIQGLTQEQKQLSSKYFYDKRGDQLFEAIMESQDYYLTRCEMEIFTDQSKAIVDSLVNQNSAIELIELGPGNCAKSIHLLHALNAENITFQYVPIDISKNIIGELQSSLPEEIPNLKFKGLVGDYFDTLAQHNLLAGRQKVLMCLGGNIGNMSTTEGKAFCKKLRSYLEPGDRCIIGFDLLKHPAIVKRAYADREGITEMFNLNLLERINRELGADFDTQLFEHYCSYDPLAGAAKSYLVCLSDMEVNIADTTIQFTKDECIWTEISQKYSKKQIQQMANENGFEHTAEFLDSKSWFMDAIWTAV